MKRILDNDGIEPAPERSQRTPWKTFLLAHWAGVAAADFFTVEVLTPAGLKRYPVFFVIELQTRRVHIAGIHPRPAAHGWSRWPARLLIRLMGSCEPHAISFTTGSPVHPCCCRHPDERRGAAHSAAAEASQSQRVRRTVRSVDQEGLLIEWSRSVRATCASSLGSTSSTTTASETIRDSTTNAPHSRPEARLTRRSASLYWFVERRLVIRTGAGR